MRRFVVFICLYPFIATAVFYGFLAYESGGLPKRSEEFILGWCLLAAVVPALVFAAVDSLMSAAMGRARIIGTALVGYGVPLLVASVFWKPPFPYLVYALGLVTGIPAALCSWLSSERRA